MSVAVTICPPPILQFFNNAGLPNVGGSILTQVGGVDYPTYQDQGITPLPNPIPLNSRGEISNAAGTSCQLFLAQGVVYVFTIYDAFGNQLDQASYVTQPAPFVLTQASIGALLFPIVPDETNAGFTAASLSLQYPYGNMLRYGIVANSTGAAANNLAVLLQLFNPLVVDGPVGDFEFPNITGADVYTFGVVGGTSPTVPMRPGIRIHGNHVTLNVTGTSTANDVNVGFLYTLSDFVIEDVTINSAVNTGAGDNAAACLYFGARGAGYYFGTVTENTWSPSFGRIVCRNITLNTTNTGGQGAPPIVIIGGEENVLIENYTINCNGVAISGIYSEWGYYSNPTGTVPGTAVTSHAKNVRLLNGRVLNSTSFGVDLRSCYNSIVDGLYTNGCGGCFDYNPGQAMFYNVGPNDTVGAKRSMTICNLVEQSSTYAQAGIQLAGSNSAIAGVPPNAWGQTDLMYFDVQGFAASSMVVSGNITARNGVLNGLGAVLNPLTIQDDERCGEFIDVQILNGTGSGIRADVAGTGAWTPARNKYLIFRQCLIAGNVTAGVELNHVQNALFFQCQFGFNSLNDPANEATQTLGILVDSGCNGVTADSCIVTTSGGAAYSITGTNSSGCNVRNPILIANGSVTLVGLWDIDGVSYATSADMASKTSYPNLGYKYLGKLCMNNSLKIMYQAQGSSPTSTWISVADGSTTITPS